MPCLRAILQHWENVDKSLGVLKAVVLSNQYTLTRFRTDVAMIGSIIQQQEALEAEVVALNTQRDEARAELIAVSGAFIGLLNTHRKEVGVYKTPGNYHPTLDPRAVRDKCKLLEVIWTELDEKNLECMPSPIVIRGMNREQFVAGYKRMMSVDHELYMKRREATTVGTSRNAMITDGIVPLIKEYKKKIAESFAPDDTLRTSLDEIFTYKGARPIVVDLRGHWDAPTKMAVLTWPPNQQPELSHYEVRACHGEKYKIGSDFHVGFVSPDRSSFENNDGMSALGCIRTYRVLVVTTENRSRLSNPVTITVTKTTTKGKLQKKYKYKG